eukprot:gene8681-628_t
MNRTFVIVVLVMFYQTLSVPMTCIGGGVATLGAQTLGCGSSLSSANGEHAIVHVKYNYYCQANCPNGRVKLDGYSYLKMTFSDFICSKNGPTSVLRFGRFRRYRKTTKPVRKPTKKPTFRPPVRVLKPTKPNEPAGSIKPSSSGSSCRCSVLVSALRQQNKNADANVLENAANVACSSNTLEEEQAETLEAYVDALEALEE